MQNNCSADIYITPYRQEAQIVSGTLAIALGAGKAIISTPYWHAQELLADGRGILVPFDDPASIAGATIRLLDNDAERHTMRKRAYLHSRGTTWQRTAQAYMASFQRARTERILRPRPSLQDTLTARSMDELPALDLAHLRRMTDDTGILQHAVFSVPNCKEGYTTDDNARALIVSVLLQESSAFGTELPANLSGRYLAFLEFAFHPCDRPIQKLPGLQPPMAGECGVGRQPWPGAMGAWNRAWPFYGSRSARRKRPVVRIRFSRLSKLHQSTRMGVLGSGHAGIS